MLFQNTLNVFTEFLAPQLKVWFSGEQKYFPSGAHLHPMFQLTSWKHLLTYPDLHP